MSIKYKIEAINIFLERRKTRMLVGRLAKENDRFIFTYDEKYLRAKNVISFGPEFPRTQRRFESPTLFNAFVDRIPSRRNPAYADYCKYMGIDVSENDPFVLLANIGKRGPSSFVFAPVYQSQFTAEDVINFRKTLGFTTREFAHVFEISQPTLTAIENKKIVGHEVSKWLETIIRFPRVALQSLMMHGEMLLPEKLQKATDFLLQLAHAQEAEKLP